MRRVQVALFVLAATTAIYIDAFVPPNKNKNIDRGRCNPSSFPSFCSKKKVTTTTQLHSSSSTTLIKDIASTLSSTLDRTVQLVEDDSVIGLGGGGGGGAKTLVLIDTLTNTKYFVKSAPKSIVGDMLEAEYKGVAEIASTNTVRVPTPIAFGESGGNSSGADKNNEENDDTTSTTITTFVIFEYLNFTYGCSSYELGKELAKMHKHTSPDHTFGFYINNTIGATPQINAPTMETWADFWDVHRLKYMLDLTNNVGGMSESRMEDLRVKVREILGEYDDPVPSLLHGDLWGGNKGCVLLTNTNNIDDDDNDGGSSDDDADTQQKKINVIFDPAPYYGDREADIAMTYLFGGFDSKFYEGYESEWPLPEGHEKRRIVYNLYHILNHYYLFSGSYKRDARNMIKEILNS